VASVWEKLLELMSVLSKLSCMMIRYAGCTELIRLPLSLAIAAIL
jgi:hypothetical protein